MVGLVWLGGTAIALMPTFQASDRGSNDPLSANGLTSTRPCDASPQLWEPRVRIACMLQVFIDPSRQYGPGESNISLVPEVVLRIGEKGFGLIEKSQKENFDNGSVTGLYAASFLNVAL